MHRITTSVVVALTALLLAATLAPAQAAAPAATEKGLAVGSTDARRASQCFEDRYSPGTQRDVQICVGEPGDANVFNFWGKVKPHGKFKIVKLQRRPITRDGKCPPKHGWYVIGKDKTDAEAMYSFRGIRRLGCYRVVVPASPSHQFSLSERIKIVRSA